MIQGNLCIRQIINITIYKLIGPQDDTKDNNQAKSVKIIFDFVKKLTRFFFLHDGEKHRENCDPIWCWN